MEPDEKRPITEWSDQEVLAVAELQMAPTEDRRFSELLNKQQAATLAGPEQDELSGLMLLYQEGLLKKAQALAEAVYRGLREPLQP